MSMSVNFDLRSGVVTTCGLGWVRHGYIVAGVSISSDATYNDGADHVFALVWDRVSDTATIYVDNTPGTPVDLSSMSAFSLSPTGKVVVGTFYTDGTGYRTSTVRYDGDIHDILVYNGTALTASQVSDLTEALTVQNPGVDGLAHWWPLNEASGTRVDAHGAADLTDVNTVASATGLVDTLAADFERDNNEYLKASDGSTGVFSSGAFSISLWFKPESSIDMDLVSKWNSYLDDRGLILRKNLDGTLTLFVSTDGTGANTISASSSAFTFTNGQWYHIAVSVTSAGVTFHVNGSSEYVVSASMISNNNTQGFVVGTTLYDDGTASLFQPVDGLIENVAIYQRALDDRERAWLYNEGAGRAYADLT